MLETIIHIVGGKGHGSWGDTKTSCRLILFNAPHLCGILFIFYITHLTPKGHEFLKKVGGECLRN